MEESALFGETRDDKPSGRGSLRILKYTQKQMDNALLKQRDGIAEMVEGIAKETSDADEMMVIRCVALAIRAFTQEEPPCESKEE